MNTVTLNLFGVRIHMELPTNWKVSQTLANPDNQPFTSVVSLHICDVKFAQDSLFITQDQDGRVVLCNQSPYIHARRPYTREANLLFEDKWNRNVLLSEEEYLITILPTAQYSYTTKIEVLNG